MEKYRATPSICEFSQSYNTSPQHSINTTISQMQKSKFYNMFLRERNRYQLRDSSKEASQRLRQISNERIKQSISIRRSCEFIPKELVVDLKQSDLKLRNNKLPDFKKFKGKEGFKLALKKYTSIPTNLANCRVTIDSPANFPSYNDLKKVKIKKKKESINGYNLKKKIHQKITKSLKERNSVRKSLRTESKKLTKIIERKPEQRKNLEQKINDQRPPSMLNFIPGIGSPSEPKLPPTRRVDLTVQLPILPSPVSESPIGTPLPTKILKLDRKKMSLKRDLIKKNILEFINKKKDTTFNNHKAEALLENKKFAKEVHVKERLKSQDISESLKKKQKSKQNYRRFSILGKDSEKSREEAPFVQAHSKPLQKIKKPAPKKISSNPAQNSQEKTSKPASNPSLTKKKAVKISCKSKRPKEATIPPDSCGALITPKTIIKLPKIEYDQMVDSDIDKWSVSEYSPTGFYC
ncbi:unnamed protein product [Moneuplotes crassus]|uniref:Uncharacterized protein n=1 Tax=Euplotes crassus TaxID=5936 RepID=A0AAD1XA47_EUPCR|nr:unnamed protein product [Moneuplotes crassus]